MAASDRDSRTDDPPRGEMELLGQSGLRERLEEEIGRAERHRTGLSCLLVVFDDLDAMAREHGPELREQMVEYVARALRRELRGFDRVGRACEHNLAVLLPGADGPRGEIVARRALERLRTIKIESRGARLPLQVSVGLAAWREGLSADELLAQARAATRPLNGNHNATTPAAPGGPAAAQRAQPEPPAAHVRAAFPSALGRASGQ
jgi:diguanylate cyclase (GGDEF)-like protein